MALNHYDNVMQQFDLGGVAGPRYKTARRSRIVMPRPFLTLLLSSVLVFRGTVFGQDSAPHGSFSLSGSLDEARVVHTSTLLPDGRVLVAGGGVGPDWVNGFETIGGAERFDPFFGKFTPAGVFARQYHTATLLPSGQVFLAGGEGGSSTIPTPSTAALYDPASGQFQPTGTMLVARELHTATLLQDGRVLIAAGTRPNGIQWEPLSFAEIYDPATGTFSATGSLNEARYSHAATLLADGRVLIAGGVGNTGKMLASAEIYDPATGIFTPTASMTFPRSSVVATLLKDGRALITGSSLVAEVYDPAAGSFQMTGVMTSAPLWHTATLLRDGTILVAGGAGNPAAPHTAEIYDPATNSFQPTGNLNFARVFHTATLLPDGRVAIIGGASMIDGFHLNFINSAETYTPPDPSGSISASPNPCNSSAGVCTSYITWTTNRISIAQVWVKIDNGPEVLYKALSSCAGADCAAPWIQGGGLIYTFTLYDCDAAACTYTDHSNARVIGSVQVSATAAATQNFGRR
jgi:hypothetical protein